MNLVVSNANLEVVDPFEQQVHLWTEQPHETTPLS